MRIQRATATSEPNLREVKSSHMLRWIALSMLIILILGIAYAGYEEYEEYTAATGLVSYISAQNFGWSYMFLKGLTITLTLVIQNPSSHSTPKFSANYFVVIDGITIGSGTITQISVPGEGSVSVPFSTTFRLSEVAFATLRAYLQNQAGGSFVGVM